MRSSGTNTSFTATLVLPLPRRADGIPVVQQRDLRYGNQCGTDIDELHGLVNDGNAQDIQMRMVTTAIKIPRPFLDQIPAIDMFRLHRARGQHTSCTELSAGKYFVDDVLWIERSRHPGARREQSNRPRRRTVPSTQFYHPVQEVSQRPLQSAIYLRDDHV